MGRTLLAATAFAALGLPPGSDVTFTRDVAPILFENCTECHRPGQPAPFPLVSYADAKKRASMLALVAGERLMPPWPPVEEYGDFVGERYLEPGEIAALRDWAEQGAPEGDPHALPDLPFFPEGDWKLGPPDLVLEMPSAFEVPAGGPDVYRMFPLHARLEQDRWLRAVEIKPGQGGALHHARVGYDPTLQTWEFDALDAEAGFEGMEGGSEATFGLGSYVIGSGPFVWPEGLAQRIPAGADIVLNSHISPVGRPVTERTTVGLYFTDRPAERSVVFLSLPPSFGAYAGIDIPPGAKDYRVTDSFVLPVDALLYMVKPHAHYLGREIRLDATPPGEARRTLFLIDNWSFEWQAVYRCADPVELAAGTRLDAVVSYDNSADNPANPFQPPQRVRFGLKSTEEMAAVGLALVAVDPAEHQALHRGVAEKGLKSALRADGTTRRPMLASRFRLYDRDQDGQVTLVEVPESSHAQFAAIDGDGDRVLVEAELEALQ